MSRAARNRASPFTGLAGVARCARRSGAAHRRAGHLVVHRDQLAVAGSGRSGGERPRRRELQRRSLADRAPRPARGRACGRPWRTKPAAARSADASCSTSHLRRRRLVQLLHGGEGQQRFEQGDRVLAQVELAPAFVTPAGERGDLGDVARAGIALGDERHAERVALGRRGEVLDPGRLVRRDVQPLGDVGEPSAPAGRGAGQPFGRRPLRRRHHLAPAQLPRHRRALQQLEQHVVDALGRVADPAETRQPSMCRPT